MNLFKTKLSAKEEFIRAFRSNIEHHWIIKNPKVLKCFELLFQEFREEHFKFFTKTKVSFVFSYAELSFSVGNLKNEYVVVIFPDLFAQINTGMMPEVCATLAHELGHIYCHHHQRKISALQAQYEADQFAVSLGFREELIFTLKRYAHLEDVQKRLERLNFNN